MNQPKNAQLYQTLKAEEDGSKCAGGQVVGGFALIPDDQHAVAIHPGVEPFEDNARPQRAQFPW